MLQQRRENRQILLVAVSHHNSGSGVAEGESAQRRRDRIYEHGISLVFPVDYTGKRRARVATACEEKRVLEAQYRNAVRLAIDDLYTAYVDALSARETVRFAEAGIVGVQQAITTQGKK